MQTNPVVIRRIMAGLREHGYVQSEKGHGGGWTLACDQSKLSLRDVYAALGNPSVLALGNRTEAPGCLVEQAVNAALGKTFHDVEQLLLARLGEVTLAQLAADVKKRGSGPKRSRAPHAGGHPRRGVGHADRGRVNAELTMELALTGTLRY